MDQTEPHRDKARLLDQGTDNMCPIGIVALKTLTTAHKQMLIANRSQGGMHKQTKWAAYKVSVASLNHLTTAQSFYCTIAYISKMPFGNPATYSYNYRFGTYKNAAGNQVSYDQVTRNVGGQYYYR